MTATLRPLGAQRPHYWLLQRMLRRSGADAKTAFQVEDLSSEDWAKLVETCRGCADACACRRFLDDPHAKRQKPPSYCQNARALANLPRSADEEGV